MTRKDGTERQVKSEYPIKDHSKVYERIHKLPTKVEIHEM
jgi:hypothetical protein